MSVWWRRATLGLHWNAWLYGDFEYLRNPESTNNGAAKSLPKLILQVDPNNVAA